MKPWPALAFAIALTRPVLADQHEVPRRGEYAKIDVRLANETITTLLQGSEAERQQAIAAIEAAPQRYAPPALYVLSSVLFDLGRKDDAAFWFYAGQLRTRFDANRCADETARQAVSVLTEQYGPTINRYTFKDVPKLQALISKVVDWDRRTPHEYDHRWINLHGMVAMRAGLDGQEAKPQPMSLPKEQWDALAEKTRTDYLDGFHQALERVKEQAAAPAPPGVKAPAGWERRLLGRWKEPFEAALAHTPKQVISKKPGEAGRREVAELSRIEWNVQADTIAVSSGYTRARPASPYPYRLVKVEGNVAMLEVTAGDEHAMEWTVEYLGPDLIRLMQGLRENYRLRRVTSSRTP